MTRGIPIHYAPLATESARSPSVRINPTSQNPDSTIYLDPSFRQPPADTIHNDRIGEPSKNLPNTGEPDEIVDSFAQNASGLRVNTDIFIAEKLRVAYKSLALTIVPTFTVNLLAYAAAGHAEAVLQEDHNSALGLTHSWHQYVPAGRRIDGSHGFIAEELIFGKFLYRWKPAGAREAVEFILYIVNGRDGEGSWPPVVNHYILSEPGKKHVLDELLISSGLWLQELRGEIWMFDGGYWSKSRELWDSVKNASWDDVILDDNMKKSIRADVEGFFTARESYAKLKVPWKRGIIFYGPPGNGKTISIKAMMHTLYELKPTAVPTLYVRSLKSFFGPERSINQIFTHARQQAPCYLVFEDLDSLVTDDVRSYFLNEVDGLRSNDGILMLGSTNHLERLDPGISKRPSRFDRKYLFSNPSSDEREAYCHFWQKKLADNDDIEFPDRLCGAIAGITDGFSFAYMQEAFVASLLTIAREQENDDSGDKDPLDKYVLWKQMKVQVKILREGLESQSEEPETEQQKSKQPQAIRIR